MHVLRTKNVAAHFKEVSGKTEKYGVAEAWILLALAHVIRARAIMANFGPP